MSANQGPKSGRSSQPVEVNMTDLEAAREQGRDTPPRHNEDVHAAGTPGGGLAAGGLAGTNIGDGDPDNADLEDAMGSGIFDQDEEPQEDEDEI